MTAAPAAARATTAPAVPTRPGRRAGDRPPPAAAPEVILAAANVFDDAEHCLKANTSPHLAAQATGAREFVTGTLAGVLNGEVSTPDGQPVIFSPFGLGVLDLAVGSYVHQQARATGRALAVADFFAERRW